MKEKTIYTILKIIASTTVTITIAIIIKIINLIQHNQ